MSAQERIDLEVKSLRRRSLSSNSDADGPGFTIVGGKDYGNNAEMLMRFVPNAVARLYCNEAKEGITRARCESSLSVLFFVDISGFTPLSSKLTHDGPEGVERLSTILNNFFAEQITRISAHGGDVIKFAGDALIALWEQNRSDKREVCPFLCLPYLFFITSLLNICLSACLSVCLSVCQLACLRAVICGDILQRDLARYTADGFALKIKVSLGYGTMFSFHLGGKQQRWEFLIAGEPWRQVSLCEHDASPGDVVLSPQVWGKVCESARGKRLPSTNTLLLEILKPVPSKTSDPLPFSREIANHLAAYVPKCILKKMDDFKSSWMRGASASGNTAEQWVSGLRRCTVIFCLLKNLEIDIEIGEEEASALHLQKVFVKLQSAVYKYSGVVRQFLVDDKGCVLIAVFGLVAHSNDPERGVRSGMLIRSKLKDLSIKTAVGITTGRVFTGLVGSDVRCEFAIIGDTVNLSARLMSAAATTNDIYVDEETKSGSPGISFEDLGAIKVKGKSQAINIFRPLAKKTTTAIMNSLTKAIVGRASEREMIQEFIDNLVQGDGGCSISIVGPIVSLVRLENADILQS